MKTKEKRKYSKSFHTSKSIRQMLREGKRNCGQVVYVVCMHVCMCMCMYVCVWLAYALLYGTKYEKTKNPKEMRRPFIREYGTIE